MVSKPIKKIKNKKNKHSYSLHPLAALLGRAGPAAPRSPFVENGKLCVSPCRTNQNGFQIRPGDISHTRNRSFYNAVQLFYALPFQNHHLTTATVLQRVVQLHEKNKTKNKTKHAGACVRVCVSSQKLISVARQCQRHLSLGSLISWHYTDTHLILCR